MLHALLGIDTLARDTQKVDLVKREAAQPVGQGVDEDLTFARHRWHLSRFASPRSPLSRGTVAVVERLPVMPRLGFASAAWRERSEDVRHPVECGQPKGDDRGVLIVESDTHARNVNEPLTACEVGVAARAQPVAVVKAEDDGTMPAENLVATTGLRASADGAASAEDAGDIDGLGFILHDAFFRVTECESLPEDDPTLRRRARRCSRSASCFDLARHASHFNHWHADVNMRLQAIQRRRVFGLGARSASAR